jgi:YHS domain-containing protein
MLILLATGAVALTGAVARLATAADTKAVCPVSGAAAKTGPTDAWTHVNGQSVYFCCNNCPKAFAADPEKYAAKMSIKCPVMTSNAVKPDKKLRTALNNGYVYFCCAGCPSTFAQAPQKYVKELRDPVSGEMFKVSANSPHATYKGGHFLFANAENKAKFDAEPAKYALVVGD